MSKEKNLVFCYPSIYSLSSIYPPTKGTFDISVAQVTQLREGISESDLVVNVCCPNCGLYSYASLKEFLFSDNDVTCDCGYSIFINISAVARRFS